MGTGFLLLYKRFEASLLTKDYTASSGTYGRTIPLPDDGIKSAGAEGQKSILIILQNEGFSLFFRTKLFLYSRYPILL